MCVCVCGGKGERRGGKLGRMFLTQFGGIFNVCVQYSSMECVRQSVFVCVCVCEVGREEEGNKIHMTGRA